MIKSPVFLQFITVIAPLGPVSGLVSQTARDISGSGGCGRGTERVEDPAGSGGLWPHYPSILFYPEIFPAGSDAEAGPAALLPAGGPEGPDDGAEETQAEDGLAQLCSQSDQHRGQTLKQLYQSVILIILRSPVLFDIHSLDTAVNPNNFYVIFSIWTVVLLIKFIVSIYVTNIQKYDGHLLLLTCYLSGWLTSFFLSPDTSACFGREQSTSQLLSSEFLLYLDFLERISSDSPVPQSVIMGEFAKYPTINVRFNGFAIISLHHGYGQSFLIKILLFSPARVLSCHFMWCHDDTK